MNLFKRVMTSIIRQLGKNVLLFGLILIIGIILAGAISVRSAIIHTENSLMMRLPAITAIEFNEFAAAEATGVPVRELDRSIWHMNRPTAEDILAIGELPYVRIYDFRMLHVSYSQNLHWAYLDLDENRLPGNLSPADFMYALRGIRPLDPDRYLMEFFHVTGVGNPNMTDIELGVLTLVDGRTFTQEEIDNSSKVVVVSQQFAQTNNLSVGSTIQLETIFHDTIQKNAERISDFAASWHDERFFLVHQVSEFEVIGLFDIVEEFPYENYNDSDIWGALSFRSILYSTIFMPFDVASDAADLVIEGRMEIQDELIAMFGDSEMQEAPFEAIFLLNNPRDIEKFSETASEMLPEFWQIADFSHRNDVIVASMDTLLGMADFIHWTTLIASIVILVLVSMLFLRDRRHEIGIYLALGDKKRQIVGQLLLEISVVAIVAMMVALFIGNQLSSNISRELLQQALIEQHEETSGAYARSLPWALMHFEPRDMSIEEMMEMYDVSLDSNVVVTFLLTGTGVVLLSTLIPVLYVLKMKPKEILL